MFQLNVRKQSAVHQSVMNDEGLKDFDILAISEPHAWMMERRVMTSPMSHSKWTRIVPTIQSNRGRWPIRSMLWVRKDIEAEQILIASADRPSSTRLVIFEMWSSLFSGEWVHGWMLS